MNNLKITLRLLNDSTIFQNQNLLEENSFISINNGNDLLIDLSQQLMTSRSKRSNNNIKGTNISSYRKLFSFELLVKKCLLISCGH